jgi:drug/metabolite transporter (DMT)-like permease
MSTPAPPEPTSTPDAGGCLPILLVMLGVIMLLPGLCVIVLMIAENTLIPRDGGIVLLWIICLAVSALGIYLMIIAYRRSTRS